MPYVIISTQIRLQTGPCVVGDSTSDEALMKFLEAKFTKELGNNFSEWVTQFCPREVLDKLEEQGYTCISTTGVGQTCIWTCYKPGI